jgi:hypothetical protein
MSFMDRFYAGKHNYSIPFIVVVCCVLIVVVMGALRLGSLDMKMSDEGADHPHQWFAWYPVRLQGGQPIPSVQLGGRVVWLKTIERTRFFNRWVYREIGDKRELTR